MSELKRWADDGASDEVRSLLTAAAAEQPSRSSLGRTLSALAAGAAVGAGSATASGAAAGAGVKVASLASDAVVRWVMATTVLTTGGAAAVAVFHDPAPRETPASSAAPAANSDAPLSQSARAAAPSVATAELAPAVLAEVPAARASAPPKTLAMPADPLAGELAFVDGARGALLAGEPHVALRALDQYDAQSSRRGFASEALYLRMRALLALGRNEEARSVAGRLASGYPNSPQAARARQILAGDDSVIQP